MTVNSLTGRRPSPWTMSRDRPSSLHEDGFALVPGVLSPEEVAALRDAIDRLQPFGFDSTGTTEHYKCVFNREQVFLTWHRPGIVDLAEKTMGEQCHIIGQTAWRSHPGHNGWGPHADELRSRPGCDIRGPDFRLPILSARRTITSTTSPTRTTARPMSSPAATSRAAVRTRARRSGTAARWSRCW